MKDHAVLKDEGCQKSYTSEEVISQVRRFLCTSVFKCQEKDLSKDSVILVCGSWALQARIWKTSPTRVNKKLVKKFISDLSQTTVMDMDMEDDSIIKEEEFPQWFELLEHYSNIKALEER